MVAREAAGCVEAISRELGEPHIVANLRNRLAGAAYLTALSHHHAIADLLQLGHIPSAFALFRSEWEAFVRGMWLRHCAADEEIERVAQGGKLPKPEQAVKALVDLPESPAGQLYAFKKAFFSVLCDYAHTGALQLQRWQGTDAVEPQHSPHEAREVAHLANLYGVFSAVSLAAMAEDSATAERLAALVPDSDKV